VTESAQLLRMLVRIRRRARWLAAVEGAVAGGAAGTAVLAIVRAVARARGAALGWRVGAALAVLTAVVGAVLFAARRIPLARCARLLDAAIDGPLPSRDRALSALSFADAPATPFSRAAIADAIARAERFGPSAVAPARRPRTLPLLAGGALALAIVGLVPARAPASRRTPPGAPIAGPPREPRLRIAASALDAERAEARAVAEAADAAGDVHMAKLAAELRAALDAMAKGELGQGEALDRLRELAARARDAADDSESQRAGLRAAGKALEPTSSTRPLGRALAGDAPDATQKALDALADRAGEGGEADRAALARALEAAAAAAGEAGAGETAGAEGEQRRRLNRDRPGAGTNNDGAGQTAARAGERRLERLHRDLNDAAAGCRGDAETCGRKLRERGGELPNMQREAARASERRRLETAVRQLRERLRRGELGEPRAGQREGRFSRAARGQDSAGEQSEGEASQGATQGEARGGDDPAMADAEGEGESAPDETGRPGAGEGQGSQGGTAAAGESEAARGQGAGIGNEPGGDPLGAGATPPTRGREREAHLKGTAGPTRSEVIEASAQRGFASGDYQSVFDDYHAVVEESLAAGAVPEGRRYLVRRYFQLIRPRTGSHVAPARKP
jgi:hypothetical protein